MLRSLVFGRSRRWLDWGLLIGWLALIFLVSAQPSLPVIPMPWYADLPNVVAHALEFAVLAVLWWRALSPEREISLRLGLLVWLLALLYAVSDEWHQRFVPNRQADLKDIFFDASGAALALYVVWRWRRSK